MKKSFIFVISATALSLAACGNIGSGKGENLKYSLEDAHENLNNLGLKTGYEIEFKYQDEESKGNILIGSKGNCNWNVIEDEDHNKSGSGFVKSDDKLHYFSVNDDGDFEYSGSLNKEQADYYYELSAAEYAPWLFYGNSYDGMMVKKGSTKVAGRSATEYELDMGLTFGIAAKLSGLNDFKFNVAIDNELGITLSVKASAKTSGGTDVLDYCVTSFKTGSSVNVPKMEIPANTDDENGDSGDSGDETGDETGGETGDETGGGSEGTTPITTSRETRFNSEDELSCSYNKMFVAKYVGNETELEEDSLFVQDLGSDSIYFVWEGFKSDGSLDRVNGYCRMYYFYSDKTSYDEGIAKAGYWLRKTRSEKLYFTCTALDVDAETYDELVSNFNNANEYYYPRFEVVM